MVGTEDLLVDLQGTLEKGNGIREPSLGDQGIRLVKERQCLPGVVLAECPGQLDGRRELALGLAELPPAHGLATRLVRPAPLVVREPHPQVPRTQGRRQSQAQEYRHLGRLHGDLPLAERLVQTGSS